MARKASMTGGEELLNIKQAARILNASEVSLRRWTDAGLLPCVRVGARRERRFRREDLFAFPETGKPRPGRRSGNRRSGQGTGHLSISLEGLAIDYSNHLCALYETDGGRSKLAVPFLADGIRNDDICYLVGAAEGVNEILGHLREVAPQTDRAIGSGQLVIWNGFESVQVALATFEQAFLAASRAGRQGLRVVGDMAWFLEHGMDFSDLESFEISYNHKLAHRFAVISLCLYDVRRFSGREVLGALKCHEDTFRFPLTRFLGP
ncbi:MAG: MEDS domain-containing protein [Rhodothalassiaceae bacterium]